MKRPRVLRVIKCHFEMRLMTWASVEADLAKLMRALLVVSVLTARLVTVGNGALKIHSTYRDSQFVWLWL